MDIHDNNRISMYVIGNDIPINCQDLDFIYVNNLDELTLDSPSVIILALEPKKQNQALLSLHQDFPLWNSQVYVLQGSTLTEYLSDGIFDPFKITEQWKQHQSKLSLIEEAPTDKLLAWLWLGLDRRLLPLCQSEKRELYYYPLLHCYFAEDYEPYHYFQLEEKRGYLEKLNTVDKIRLCSSCHSGHLNYIETCPDCKSTNIEEILSLHCFTCGHVGKEQRFVKQDKLQCPNCFTKLRHIGVDYDRPLERYQCRDCQLSFSESVVRVRCLSCFHMNETSELIARPINQFKVGEQVKGLMMYGRRPIEQALSLNGLIDQNSFHNLLVWINKLAIRHEQHHLLLGVQLSGIDSYSKEFGEIKRIQLIDEISSHFNGLLRDTDICCQYNSELMLLLMPMTPRSSHKIIEDKVANIASDIESELVTLHLYIWELPDPSLSNSASVWLVDLLKDI
ncbi:hypothetical protein [Aliivibrio fischeri]|uniref:TackOD1 domain-containing metal-binding protein n=1 Tax=Aliivibrio fischeri TaxID=668 RepID=UPI0012DADBD3|nr:hypothetical protein [Aliivibrio fischeri]MUL17449.1 hypothetical protein [Aliivibrio fischeri]